jgi:hypothetical protein
MREVGSSSADQKALIEAQRRAEEARKAAEAKRKAEEARQAQEAAQRAAAEAAQKAGQLAKVVAADRVDDRLKRDTAKTSQLTVDALSGGKSAADRLPPITSADLAADPAVGKQLAKLAKSDDPAVKQYLKDTAAGLVQESLKKNLAEKTGQAALDGFTGDVATITKKTGLGDVMKGVADDALKSAARDLLFKGVDAEAVKANSALGQVLATLQDDTDPAVKAKLGETVRGWTDAALEARLEGQEGEDAVTGAVEGYGDDLRKLADATGLADTLTSAGEDSLKDQEDHIKELSSKGKNIFEKGLDVVGNVIGKGLDLGGDLINGATDAVSGAAKTVSGALAKGIEAGWEKAGEGVNAAADLAGKGVEAATGVAAGGLEAVGADGVADLTRSAGRHAARAADVAGDVGEKALGIQGKISSTVVGLPVDVVAGTLDGVGDAANTGLDVAGAVAADGPMGAAEKLANETLGPEKAEYAGQVDGLTGLITNRLGAGDSVFLLGSAGAEVGFGANAGASVNGAGASTKTEAYVGATAKGAATLGRDKDGNITLSGEFGEQLEGGVQHESEAGEPGIQASAEARAGLTGEGRAKVTLKFDPSDKADVARLKALIEPDVGDMAKAVAAGNPLGALTVKASAVGEAMKHNFASAEVTLKGGALAEASASADLGALKVGATAEALGMAGATQKFNRDGTTDTTYFMHGSAGARAGVTRGPATLEAGGSVGGAYSVTVKKDANGEIIAIGGERSTASGETTSGKGKGNLGGGSGSQSQTKGVIKLTDSQVETKSVRTSLTAEGLAEAKRRMAEGESLLSVYRDLNDDAGKFKADKLTTTTDAFTGSSSAELALGLRVELSGAVTAGKSHTDLPDENSTLHTDLTREIWQASR